MTGPRARAAGAAALALAVAAAASGCRLLVELVEGDAAAGVDAWIPDPTCDGWSVAVAALDACAAPPPGPALVLDDGDWTFDTNSGALVDPANDATFPTSALVTPPGGPEVRVVSVGRFELTPGATLRVHGRRPLVILSWSIAEVDGHLDATSRRGAPAAGADPETCAATAARAGEADSDGAGGGGGGGASQGGAEGGSGDEDRADGGDGGAASPSPGPLRGGCAGARGGNAQAGAGGPGGGAVLVAAREWLRVGGTITAGGAGGAGAQGGRAGGGGGGAGGLVGLASAEVVIEAGAILAANGGGGGGGSDGSPATAGADGAAAGASAAAGAGQGMGGGGGAGGSLVASPVDGRDARRGGGGGGGGAGWIVIDGGAVDVSAAATVSPARWTP